MSLFTPDFDLYDLNRVETLRGPQGTLFGSGSIGGTIRYITNAPSLDGFEGSVELNAHSITDGDVGWHVKGMINTVLSDTAVLRVTAYTTEYGGYIDASMEGGGTISDVNSGNRTGIRAAVTFMPNDTLTITPRIIYQDIDTDGFNRQEVWNLFANPDTTTRPPVQLGEREQHLLLREGFSDETMLADLLVEASFSNFDVTFIGSFMDRNILVSRDASALTGSVSVNPFAGLGFPEASVNLPSNLLDATDFQQTTFELRFSSNSDGPLQWLVGAFTSQVDRDYGQTLPTPGYDAIVDSLLGDGTSAAVANGVAPPDSPFASALPYDIEQSAFFGEITYDISDVFHLTVGGRFYDFNEVRRIVFGGIFADPVDQIDKTSSDGFTPRVLVSYEMNDNVTLNAQVSQGFRLGGVNDPLNVPLCTPEDLVIFGGITEYSDETLWNYEAGIKARFDNGVSLNAAVFYADMEDLQVTLDAGSCSSRISFNVDKAHSSGIEVELTAKTSDSFEFSIAGSALSSEFDSTAVDSLGNPLGGVEKGNRLASVPEFQIAATGTFYFPVSWAGGSDGYFSATVHHVGDRITQPTDQLSGAGDFLHDLAYAGMTGLEVTSIDLVLDAYTLVNLSAGIIKDDWEAVLYVHNASDENALLSFDRERGGRARLSYRTNQPRTIGLTYRKRFGD